MKLSVNTSPLHELSVIRRTDEYAQVTYPYLNLQTDEGFRVRILQESVRQERARMYRLQQHAPHEYGFESQQLLII